MNDKRAFSLEISKIELLARKGAGESDKLLAYRRLRLVAGM
jgi:hypothetical protein